ncbi:hypothetical protein ACEWY4_017260 [Coilia grayii]|uniref:Ig-like domain-containing protein n=1 Tax=Coilia grayii TaxID=363190 RepID=A0ABD1JGB9_9TELE
MLKAARGHFLPLLFLLVLSRVSPKNTFASVSPVVITDSITTTLTCSSDANPPVESYTWFKVNQSTPVGSGQQYSISNIRSEDGGLYYCEARNKHGAENSSAVSITVAVSTTTTSTTTFHHTVMAFHPSTIDLQRSDKSGAAGVPSAGGAHDDDVQYSSVLVQRPGDSKASVSTRGAQDDVQYSSVFVQRPGDSGAAGSIRGTHEDDVQAAVFAGGGEDDVQYSSARWKHTGEPAGDYGKDVHHADVHFMGAAAVQGDTKTAAAHHGVAAQEWRVWYSADLCALNGSSVEMSCMYTFPPNLTVHKAFWMLGTQPVDDADLTQDPAYAGRAGANCGDKQSKCTLRLRAVSAADASTTAG